MYLPLHELATGTILARSPAHDHDFTGAAPVATASLMANDQDPQRVQSLAKPKPSSLAELLFEATAAAKVWTSHVAMRLDRETRDRFFRQLDRLHDIEEWVDDGKPLDLCSYKTFVRSIIFLKLDEKPALALMTNGNLLAIWTRGESKLSIEFRANDAVRWVLAEPGEGRIDRVAGDTGFSRLRSELALRGSENWFS